MKAIDTNILVYAHREEYEQCKTARKILTDLSEDHEPWALPWPCVYEFLRVVTHPKILTPPTKMSVALANISELLKCPSLIFIQETERHLDVLMAVTSSAKLGGNLVFDAHIVALMIEHGIKDIITSDNDFRNFQQINVINPFR